MNSLKSLVSLVFIAALSYSQASSAQTYPLLCKGGAGMRFWYRLGTGGFSMLNVNFKPGANNAQAGTLKEGECTWFDRTFNANEYKKICFKIASVEHAWTGDSRGAFALGVPGKSYGTTDVVQMMYMDLVQNKTVSIPEFKNTNYIFQVKAFPDQSCLLVYREGM